MVHFKRLLLAACLQYFFFFFLSQYARYCQILLASKLLFALPLRQLLSACGCQFLRWVLLHHRANLTEIALCMRARLRASQRQRSRDMKQQLQQRQMAAISLKELLSRVFSLTIRPASKRANRLEDSAQNENFK